MSTRTGWLDNLENTYYDLWHNLAGIRFELGNVVIVAIDDQTLIEHQDDPLVFWTPYFAQAIKVLRQAGAKIIGLDCLFSVSPESWLKKIEVYQGNKSRNYDIPIREQLSSGQVILVGTLVTNEHGETEFILPVKDYLFVLPGGIKDVGLSNFYYDNDSVVRNFLLTLYDDVTMSALTFANLLAVRSADLDPANESWSFGSWELKNFPSLYMIGFVGPPGTIPRISFNLLLSPHAEKDPVIQRIKDKIVIIALEHSGGTVKSVMKK